MQNFIWKITKYVEEKWQSDIPWPHAGICIHNFGSKIINIWQNSFRRIAYNIYLCNKKIKYGQIFVIFGLKLIIHAYVLEYLGKCSRRFQLSGYGIFFVLISDSHILSESQKK